MPRNQIGRAGRREGYDHRHWPLGVAGGMRHANAQAGRQTRQREGPNQWGKRGSECHFVSANFVFYRYVMLLTGVKQPCLTRLCAYSVSASRHNTNGSVNNKSEIGTVVAIASMFYWRRVLHGGILAAFYLIFSGQWRKRSRTGEAITTVMLC